MLYLAAIAVVVLTTFTTISIALLLVSFTLAILSSWGD